MKRSQPHVCDIPTDTGSSVEVLLHFLHHFQPMPLRSIQTVFPNWLQHYWFYRFTLVVPSGAQMFEPLFALCTLVGLLSSVGPEVSHQLMLLYKLSSTLRALKWFLPCVGSLMTSHLLP